MDIEQLPLEQLQAEAEKKAGADGLYQLGLEFMKLYKTNHVRQCLLNALDCFIVAVQKGSSDAPYQLAICYDEDHLNFSSDRFYWLSKSATQNNMLALFQLGRCYERGIGVLEDRAEALLCYQRAIDRGCVEAMCHLAHMHLHGQGTDKNLEKAAQLFKRAGDASSPEGYYYYAKCLVEGTGVPQDVLLAYERFLNLEGRKANSTTKEKLKCFEEACKLFQKRQLTPFPPKLYKIFEDFAKDGNAKAQTYLAICYDEGIGVGINGKKAVNILQKAVKSGDALAQQYLGLYYIYGSKQIQDTLEGIRLLKESAMQKNPDALCFLGTCFSSGIGVKQDTTKALRYYFDSMESGSSLGAYLYGYHLYHGKGIPKDIKSALFCYKKSATLGNSEGQYSLGICYLRGLEVCKDTEEGLSLLKLSARQGHKSAIHELALMNIHDYE